MSALHPYGLQNYAYLTAAVIAFGNLVFGALYMYSLGTFNEGGGSYTASMRYLKPTLSLIVAVTLIQDYVFTIVVSALSGGDQLLSVLNAYNINWFWHFLIGFSLAATTWYLTIRGRGESSKVVFTLLGLFGFLTVTMGIGLVMAHMRGIPAVAAVEAVKQVPLSQALMHMLTASMKGMVALTGLEAMSNGIQFVIDEDVALVKWGKKHLPKLNGMWKFYSGKAGIGRFVQTSFLFYGGLTTYFLTFFAIRFNVFDGTLGRTLVGNLASIGFGVLPGGDIVICGLSTPGRAAAGCRLDDRFPGCPGHRMAGCVDRRDPGNHCLPRSERHLHPFRHDYLCDCRTDHVPRAGQYNSGDPLLRRGGIYADHGDGTGDAPACKAYPRPEKPAPGA